MYRNLPATMAQIEAAGFSEYAERLITETSKPVIVPYEYTISFDEYTQVARLQRLLYELLYFYPLQKTRISLRLYNNPPSLLIKIRDKQEHRGRRLK